MQLTKSKVFHSCRTLVVRVALVLHLCRWCLTLNLQISKQKANITKYRKYQHVKVTIQKSKECLCFLIEKG